MADSKNRCMWGVTGIIPGKGWGGIQCDGIDGHGKRVRLGRVDGPDRGEFDHGNSVYGAYWNEDHENASSPDMPFVHPGDAVPTQDAPEFGTPDDPEPGSGKCFVIESAEDGVIAVAMEKRDRDLYLSIYNMNRHSGRATFKIVPYLPDGL